jgi:hypothetical protein
MAKLNKIFMCNYEKRKFFFFPLILKVTLGGKVVSVLPIQLKVRGFKPDRG